MTHAHRAPLLAAVAAASIILSACAGAYWDGEQWLRVTVRNDQSHAVDLTTSYPTSHGVKGVPANGSAALVVDISEDPQSLQVADVDGHIMGCLTFRAKTPQKHIYMNTTEALPCDPALPGFNDRWSASGMNPAATPTESAVQV